jgi:hypothetical protein
MATTARLRASNTLLNASLKPTALAAAPQGSATNGRKGATLGEEMVEYVLLHSALMPRPACRPRRAQRAPARARLCCKPCAQQTAECCHCWQARLERGAVAPHSRPARSTSSCWALLHAAPHCDHCCTSTCVTEQFTAARHSTDTLQKPAHEALTHWLDVMCVYIPNSMPSRGPVQCMRTPARSSGPRT